MLIFIFSNYNIYMSENRLTKKDMKQMQKEWDEIDKAEAASSSAAAAPAASVGGMGGEAVGMNDLTWTPQSSPPPGHKDDAIAKEIWRLNKILYGEKIKTPSASAQRNKRGRQPVAGQDKGSADANMASAYLMNKERRPPAAAAALGDDVPQAIKLTRRAKKFKGKIIGGKRKTRNKRRKKRKTKKKSKRKKRKKRKTRRKQKGGSNINFKQKLLIKIKENKTELKNLFNNSMKRYYRGKKVIKFEDLTNIVENMDEKKLIMYAEKIGKLIKEKDNTKNKLGKNLRGGNPEVLFIFLGINSICAIFALLFYIMYNLVFPDEVASLYLFIAGGQEGIRNRHPNLTDEQIETRIEEKSKEFQAFLAFTNFIACMLGAFSLIYQMSNEPPQRSYNHIFDFSLMLEDSGQAL